MTDLTVEQYDYGGKFRLPDLYGFIVEEGIELSGMNGYEYLSDIPLQRIDVKFLGEVSYDEYNFIPVGTQCVLLNEDVMLIGVWGKILVAYRNK
ncbi:hypothetical protein LJC58_07630 [Lachnospiraceae bacterium OttesenSCG-928-D06]|nr:hypothetical protein [Lachnospiraceae bacterium OttesenSCG-928-D06]